MNNLYLRLIHLVLIGVQHYLYVVLAMYNDIELMEKNIQLEVVIVHQDDIDKLREEVVLLLVE